MFAIEIVPDALDELNDVPVFYRRAIEREIEKKLGAEPTRVSKNIKSLEACVAGFEHEEPLWELRVGDYRVFYDVDDREKIVVIRAVRYKATKTTGEII